MNFGEWYKNEYGTSFDVSFEEFGAGFECDYVRYCEQKGIEPDWQGRDGETS